MTEDVLIATDGRVGRISLNRPKAIHALNLAMCQAMIDALVKWREDDAVEAVIIDHSEGRGFCAGGDIRMLAESGAKDGKEARVFFHTEYRLNHLLFTYPKPVVAFMDGITMGGGVGFRSPRNIASRPNIRALRCPRRGSACSPTSAAAGICRASKAASAPISRSPARGSTGRNASRSVSPRIICRRRSLPRRRSASRRIPTGSAASSVNFSVTAPPAAITHQIDRINRLFASDTYEDILAALEADGGEWATKELATLRGKSPQTCKVALRQLKEGGEMHDFAAQMTQEYAIGSRVVQMHDFIEGVRALIVDKDNSPKWDPPTPEAVTDDWIDAIFAPLPDDEKWTPLS